jgi:hypothetical protein
MGLFRRKARPIHVGSRLAQNLDEAETRHLEVLRREIANLIVAVDPDLMVRCYERAWAFEREISENPVRAQAEETALVAKFPLFSEFDLIGTRHFVPYDSGRAMLSDDDVVERYLEVSRMLVFMRLRDEFKAKYPVHEEKEHSVLLNTMRREKDRRFRKRIEDAIVRFYAYRAGFQDASPSASGVTDFEDAEVVVCRLESLGDIQYGIVFKKTEEYGVYSFFVHDDGHITHSYSRSDRAFSERASLL